MNISCLIIEDEPLAQERLKGYIEKIPALQLLACFEQAQEAQAYLLNSAVDVIWLDIHLKNISGIEWLETAALNCQVVLTTAYPEHALKGFDLQVTDYLLKPFTFERFSQAVVRVQEIAQKRKNETGYIFIKTANRVEKILLDDILFIEGMRDYRRIHTVKGKIMTLKTFTDLEAELLHTSICRIHKSFMVARHKIDKIEKNSVYIGVHQIPISEKYKQNFIKDFRK